MSEKCVVTCALTGVLTDPAQHPVPVTAAEMAASAKDAFNAGAAIMHIHFRDPEPGRGHLPSWDPDVAEEVTGAIREACPGVLVNMTTGVIGPDVSGPLACLERTRPEIAACNAGTLNYLKTRRDGSWAWPPMVFDNPVSKVSGMLEAMDKTGTRPEFECFDVGIVRSVGLYVENGMVGAANYNFVMGVASGMPADPALLELLVGYRTNVDTHWQVTAIGRQDVWPLHQRTAELGGALRTGVEDTFYLPNGEKTSGNGPLIEAIVDCARAAGREIASPAEARAKLGLH
ncbi:MAG: 3-keto-5-aminohexanoate cleavage protein [Myxococcota bacterium]